MNKVFCVSCGSKILYELKKPKFCSTCGEPLDGVTTSKSKNEEEETSSTGASVSSVSSGGGGSGGY